MARENVVRKEEGVSIKLTRKQHTLKLEKAKLAKAKKASRKLEKEKKDREELAREIEEHNQHLQDLEDAVSEIEVPRIKKPKKIKKQSTRPINPKTGDHRSGNPTLPENEGLTKAEKQRNWTRRHGQAKSKSDRDIAPLPTETINWERRLACKKSLKKHCETYHKPVFYLGWSDDQLLCLENVEQVFLESARMFALAMPRGSGKTAICRAGLQWGTAHGFRRFPYFVGSTQPKTQQTLESIKTNWYRNKELREDYPEIAYPIERIENRYHMANGQTYNGVPTAIEWGSESIRYPALLLPKDVAEEYLKHDPSALFHTRDGDLFFQEVEGYEGPITKDGDLREDRLYLSATAGLIIGTAGIGGSIRGEADTHPITLEQPRPDLILLDDVQKDVVAESPASVEKMIRVIDGAVAGLTGPGEHIAALMPCTVIMENDAADTYLNPLLKPEWNGVRCKMVTQWPAGVTDHEITQDTAASRHWIEYCDLWRVSLQRHKNFSLATEYYGKNRRSMDRGFKVSWKERYDADKFDKKGKLLRKGTELSAQQHAMNLRLKNPVAFLSEFQNIGKSLLNIGELLITAKQLSEKTVEYKRLEAPAEAQVVSAFIDVQNEIFFWAVFATDMDFNGVFCDYGTFPQTPTRYFSKSQTESWSLLTRLFFEEYPEFKKDAITTKKGHIRAPLDAKIYHGLSKLVPLIQTKLVTAQDEHKRKIPVGRTGIDTRWGQASDSVKRYIRESGINSLVPYMGQSFPATNRQLEEYEQRKGWKFEQHVNPNITEPKWVIRPNQDGMFYMASDVDRGKDFLFQRLASPRGAPGNIGLYSAPTDHHQLFADHICNSEYPEPVTARGITKNMWIERQGAFDNDWLDCSVGCLQMASMQGVSLKSQLGAVRITKRSFSAMANSKGRKKRMV
tara:strand:- start:14770 stop:17487 length:2718 start_codon:yes stop_codon:yes gene_type:complete